MQNKKTKQNKKQQQQQQQKTKKQTIKTRSKKSVLGATADDLLPFLIKHFPPKNFLLHTSSYKPFMQSIRKINKLFWINSTGNREKELQYLPRKAHNVRNRYNFNTKY